MVVENQAGAGSLIAANNVFKSGAEDGTVLVHFDGGQLAQKYVAEFRAPLGTLRDCGICAAAT